MDDRQGCLELLTHVLAELPGDMAEKDTAVVNPNRAGKFRCKSSDWAQQVEAEQVLPCRGAGFTVSREQAAQLHPCLPLSRSRGR